MNAHQLPREVPWHAVISGLPAGVILRHLNQGEINAVRRTWQLQGMHSHGRALDDALDQLKAAHANYISRTNADMLPVQIERARGEEAISDPITISQAAALLERSDRHVRGLVASGVLIGKRHGQRAWQVSRASVLAYRDARAQDVEAA